MDRFLNRRLFLKLGGMSLALTAADTALARRLGETRRLPSGDRRARLRDQRSTPLLVTVFLRGGCDGLNLTPPTEPGEYATYRTYRSGIGVDLADMTAAGTNLTDSGLVSVGWGLHPRMSALVPLWEAGQLAFSPDVHYDEGSRSHFDSQQFYENGTPWSKFTRDGWANRHLATAPGAEPSLRAIAFDNQTPFSLQGPEPALTFANLNDLSVSGSATRNARFLDTQEAAYPAVIGGPRTYDSAVGIAGRDLVGAIRWIESVALPDGPSPAAAPIYASTASGGIGGTGRHGYFSDRLIDLARLIRTNEFSIEMAQVDLYGWDTHDQQVVATNNHPDLAEALARGLAGFVTDLGDFMENTVIVVMSEFGRTARENGNAGTDHGSATSFFVLGDPSKINGRRVYHGSSGFAGLDDLREDRDLKHSLDYRSIISEVVQRHLGNDSPDVFPGLTPEPVGVIA